MGTRANSDQQPDELRQANPTLRSVIDLALVSLGNSRDLIMHYLEANKVPLDLSISDSSIGQTALEMTLEKISQSLEDVVGEGHLIVMHLIKNTIAQTNLASQVEKQNSEIC